MGRPKSRVEPSQLVQNIQQFLGEDRIAYGAASRGAYYIHRFWLLRRQHISTEYGTCKKVRLLSQSISQGGVAAIKATIYRGIRGLRGYTTSSTQSAEFAFQNLLKKKEMMTDSGTPAVGDDARIPDRKRQWKRRLTSSPTAGADIRFSNIK
jgi:hypothetical protein